MKSALLVGSCLTEGAGEDVLESAGLLKSGRGRGQVQDRGRERGSKSGSISTNCRWAASAIIAVVSPIQQSHRSCKGKVTHAQQTLRKTN